jgi:hypothetical protein
MSENLCHLINITNVILLNTTNNYIPRIDCNYNSKIQICDSINNTFRNIYVLPPYKRLIELLNSSLRVTLECDNINKSMFRGYKNSISYSSINIYDITKLLLFAMVINYIINYYKIKKIKKY